MCLDLGFDCAPPLLARLLGCMCVFVCALGLRTATSGWGLRCVGWVSPGTCSCAVVCCGLCALPGFAAPGIRCCLAPVLVPWLWPAACLPGVPRGPALVRCASVRSLPVLWSAVLMTWCLSPTRRLGPPDSLGGCAGHVETGQERGSLDLPAVGSLRVVLVRRPAMGLSLAGPSYACWVQACCPPPPPAGGGALCCALSCFVSCRAAVCGVFCVVPGVRLGSWSVLFGALLCWVLLCCFCCALLSCAAAFFAFSFCVCGVPCLSSALRAVSVSVLCLCGAVLVSLLSVQCCLAPAALAGVSCCCLLCSPVCCWAWLFSVVSWWILVASGVAFRWCAVVCPWVLCCAVLLRVVLPGVVLRCAVLFCLALFDAVARCVVSWGAV